MPVSVAFDGSRGKLDETTQKGSLGSTVYLYYFVSTRSFFLFFVSFFTSFSLCFFFFFFSFCCCLFVCFSLLLQRIIQVNGLIGSFITFLLKLQWLLVAQHILPQWPKNPTSQLYYRGKATLLIYSPRTISALSQIQWVCFGRSRCVWRNWVSWGPKYLWRNKPNLAHFTCIK